MRPRKAYNFLSGPTWDDWLAAVVLVVLFAVLFLVF